MTTRITIRQAIKDAGKAAYILVTDEIAERAEDEICKLITPEFLNKIREGLLKEKTDKPNKKPEVKQTPEAGS